MTTQPRRGLSAKAKMFQQRSDSQRERSQAWEGGPGSQGEQSTLNVGHLFVQSLADARVTPAEQTARNGGSTSAAAVHDADEPFFIFLIFLTFFHFIVLYCIVIIFHFVFYLIVWSGEEMSRRVPRMRLLT